MKSKQNQIRNLKHYWIDFEIKRNLLTTLSHGQGLRMLNFYHKTPRFILQSADGWFEQTQYLHKPGNLK